MDRTDVQHAQRQLSLLCVPDATTASEDLAIQGSLLVEIDAECDMNLDSETLLHTVPG